MSTPVEGGGRPPLSSLLAVKYFKESFYAVLITVVLTFMNEGERYGVYTRFVSGFAFIYVAVALIVLASILAFALYKDKLTIKTECIEKAASFVLLAGSPSTTMMFFSRFVLVTISCLGYFSFGRLISVFASLVAVLAMASITVTTWHESRRTAATPQLEKAAPIAISTSVVFFLVSILYEIIPLYYTYALIIAIVAPLVSIAVGTFAVGFALRRWKPKALQSVEYFEEDPAIDVPVLFGRFVRHVIESILTQPKHVAASALIVTLLVVLAAVSHDFFGNNSEYRYYPTTPRPPRPPGATSGWYINRYGDSHYGFPDEDDQYDRGYYYQYYTIDRRSAFELGASISAGIVLISSIIKLLRPRLCINRLFICILVGLLGVLGVGLAAGIQHFVLGRMYIGSFIGFNALIAGIAAGIIAAIHFTMVQNKKIKKARGYAYLDDTVPFIYDPSSIESAKAKETKQKVLFDAVPVIHNRPLVVDI